ncbi:hypothetical protein Tco_1190197 [Tanacetum coccineum]
MEEINKFQQELDETLSQAWERFKELLLRCPQHYLTNTQEVILFYKGLDVPTRQILDSKGAIPSMNDTNAKKDIQNMADYFQKWHNGTSTRARSTDISDGLAAIQAQLNNLGREIKKVNERVYAAQVGCESYFVVLDMPEDIKVPLILGRPLLSTAHAKIDVFKRKIALKIGNEKIMFQREALILNRSLNHVYEDYIDLNVLNELLELRRNHVDDLGPTIEDGEVINEPMIEETKTRNYDEENNGINEYPSFYDIDRKIRIDGAYNLQFLCMIGFEHVNTNFFSVLSINIMSKKFFNAIIRDKILFKGKNVVGAFVNVPIFIGNFYVITDFAVLENIDAYRDEGMGDIIVGKPFCREVCIKGRRFDGMITIYNGNDSVTYQMS